MLLSCLSWKVLVPLSSACRYLKWLVNIHTLNWRIFLRPWMLSQVIYWNKICVMICLHLYTPLWPYRSSSISNRRLSYLFIGIDGAGYYYWIGAQQTAVNVNSWEWIDGTNLPLSPSPPNIWYALTSEPNNPFDPNLQCVDITASTESGDLADYWCYFPLRFACEK